MAAGETARAAGSGRIAALWRLPARLGNAAWARPPGRELDCVVCHRTALTEDLPAWSAVRLLCGQLKGRLRCPAELTIFPVPPFRLEVPEGAASILVPAAIWP